MTEKESLCTLNLDRIVDACNNYFYSVYSAGCQHRKESLTMWYDEQHIKQAYDDIAADIMGGVRDSLVEFQDKEFEDIFFNYADIRVTALDEAEKMIDFVESNNLYS